MDALAQLDIGNAVDDEGIKQFNIRKNDGGIADAQLADSGFSVAGNLKQEPAFSGSPVAVTSPETSRTSPSRALPASVSSSL